MTSTHQKIEKMQYKTIPITDMKIIDDKENGKFYITGYANNKNQPDSYGDIPTSFENKPVYILDRMNKNPVAFVDHRSSASNIAGNFVELKEDEKGLFFKLLLRPLDEIHNPLTKDAVSAFMTGFGRAFSIGGEWFFEDHDNPNNLTKAFIYEISLVGIGSDADALGDTPRPKHLKHLPPAFSDLPIASKDTPWSPSDALKRVQTWIDGESHQNAETIEGKSRQAFFLKDAESTSKLLFTDIIDGNLTAVPRGIFSAGAVVASGKIKMTDEERVCVVVHLEKYYKKMNLESPFKSGGAFRVENIADLDARTLERVMRNGVSVDKATAVKIVSLVKSLLQGDPAQNDQGDPDGDDWNKFWKK